MFSCFCLKQQCAGSICEKHGLEECTCASSDGKDDRELCHVCCMRKSKICLNCMFKHSSRYLKSCGAFVFVSHSFMRAYCNSVHT